MWNWDPRTLYQDDGTIKPPSEWDDATAAVIAGVEVIEMVQGKDKVWVGQTKKVKVVDPLRTMELVLKVMGMMKESVVFPDKDGNPMAPGVQIQNRIEVVFVNAPGPGWRGGAGPVIEGESGDKAGEE